MVDIIGGEHLPHIGTAGGVTDHGGTAADEGDGFVPCHLQTLHQRKRHKMAGGQAIGGAVKADIEGRLALVDHLFDLILVGHLCNQAAGNQLFVNLHRIYLLIILLRVNKKPSACKLQAEDE